MTLKVGDLYYDVTLDTRKMVEGQREAERSLSGLERSFTKVASAVASLVAALSIEGVLRESINASRRFEKAIADLSAITGATGSDIRKLTAEAKALGSTTTASAGQVVEAMKLIASAKPELLETTGALAAVTKEAIALADASGMALPAAAEAVTLALNQFGEGADQAARFVNVLAAGAKFGASEIADTAIALKNSAVSAAAAGVSFETTNAALQALAAGGIKGGEAGTALRNVILKLENDTDKRLKPSVNGLVGALENLNRQNLSSAELTNLFGLENVNAAQALLGSADKVRELTTQLTGTQTAYEQAATNTGTFDAQLKLMNNSLELAAIKLGDELKPAAEAGARAITSIAQAFIEGGPAVEALSDAVTVLSVLLVGKGVAALAAYAVSVYRAAAAMAAATLAANGMAILGGPIAAAATAATMAVRGFTAALAFMGGPIGVAAIALAALALNWDKISGSAKSAAEISEGAADRIQAALARGGKAATQELNAQLSDARETLAKLDNDIKAGSVRSIYGDRAPVIGQKKLDQLKAQRDQVLSTIAQIESAMDRVYGTGRRPANEGGGGLRSRNAPAAEDTPVTPPVTPTGASRETEAEIKARQDLARIARVDAAEREADERARAAAAQAAQDAERQAAQQASGRALAADIIAGDDPIARLQLELERKREMLDQAAAVDQEQAQLYADARVALEEDTARRINEVIERQKAEQASLQSQQLQAYGNLFGGIADLTKTFAGKQSTAYKVLFAASKAFAIADSIIKIQQGIANAAALPFPTNLGAMASVVSATAGIISTIKGVNYGGGRQYGGPASADTLYRVNETGRPEMFTAANGAQYMLPTTNGRVTPADQVGGGSLSIKVEIVNTGTPQQVVSQSFDQDARIVRLVTADIAGQIASNQGPVWSAMRSATNVAPRQS